MNNKLCAVIAVFFWSVLAQAHSAPTAHVQPDEACRETLEAEAAHNPEVTIKEFPDYTAVTSRDRLTWYYFTKPNNKVYPWAIRAVFTVTRYKRGKDVESSIETCLPKDSMQPTSDQWQSAASWGSKVMAGAERSLLKPSHPK